MPKCKQVSIQQESVERIDTNMEEALLNVDQGHSQLVKYYNTLSGNRERPLLLIQRNTVILK